MALTNDRDKAICAKYGARDATGHVHCTECPLQVQSRWSDVACKAWMHYDKKMREWMPDAIVELRDENESCNF